MSLFNEIALEANKIGIGNTPLYKIGDTGIFSKLEYYNRFMSIKDRAAFFMIDYAIKTGTLRAGQTIIEASSGNTGIAIAGISKIFGLKSEIVIPESAPEGTKKLLENSGATVITTSGNSTENSINYVENSGATVITTSGNSTENSINYVEAMVARYPDKYFRPGQHSNIMNSNAHYYGTGPEISQKLNHIDNLVIGVGTGGTITGLSRYFKEKSNVKVTGVLPANGSKIVGLRNPFQSSYKDLLDTYKNFIDNFVTVSEDEAYEGVKELKAKYNLLCWPFVGC